MEPIRSNESKNQSVLIIGAGAFGIGLAISALENSHKVSFLSNNLEKLEELQVKYECLKESSRFNYEGFDKSLFDFDSIILAVPCQNLRDVCSWLQKQIKSDRNARFKNCIIINASKGLEQQSLKLPHEIISELLGNYVKLGTISGPSFAKELYNKTPTFVVVASKWTSVCDTVIKTFQTPYFRVHKNTDVIGVEISGALKNVVAIAAGISDGLKFGLNTRAAIITIGLREIALIGSKLGGEPLTFLGLSGVGDITLTCTGDLSRNRQFGIHLAQEKSVSDIKEKLGSTIEGLNTVKSAYTLARKFDLETPLIDFVHSCLSGKLSVKDEFYNFIMHPETQEGIFK